MQTAFFNAKTNFQCKNFFNVYKCIELNDENALNLKVLWVCYFEFDDEVEWMHIKSIKYSFVCQIWFCYEWSWEKVFSVWFNCGPFNF